MIIGSMCGGDDKPSAQREKEIRTRKARELDPHNPMATLIVSRDIRSNSMVNEGPHPRAISSVHTEAFKMLEMATRDVMNILEREPTWVKSMSRSLLVASIFLDIAEFYWAEGERNKAAKKYKESLVYNSTRYTVYLTIVERYRQHGYWSDVIDFISALHAQCKPSYHFRYMDRFIHEFLADSKFQDALAQAAEETRSWPEANKLFFFAIGLAKESPAELFHAHKAYISFIKKGPSNKATELDVIKHSKLGLACGVPEAESGTGVLYRDIFAIADPLALIYLNKAMALLHERDMLTGKSNGVPPPPPMSLHKRDRLTGKISWVSPPPPMPMPPATPDTSKALTEFKNLLDEAVAYGQQIEMLVQDTDVWANASINCCLAWYYLKMGDLEASRKALAPLMAASIALLSDDDPSNDWFAILYLGRALTTLQDRKNAHMAWSILKFLLPDDIKDPLLVCRVCEESVRLGPGDVICTTCYGPVFKHEECHRNLPISDSIGCARGHGFMEIPRKEGQLDPTAVHTWNNQLRERYVLGRVPVKEEDLTPSALVKQGTVRIKSYAEVVAVKEETKPRWRNQSARMGAGPPAVPRSGYNAADISGVSAEAIQLGRKSERMGAMMTAGFSDWADAALGQQFYVTGMQEGFGRGPSPEIRREIFPELKRELQSTVRQRASNHVSAKEDGNWTKKDGKWIAISTLRK